MTSARYLSIRQHPAWRELLPDWWRRLDDDPGGRAALRRAPDLTAVTLQPAFQRLYRRLLKAGWPDDTRAGDRLAAAAGLLAHLREAADHLTLPKAMSGSPGDKPPVSELRFKRLLESPDIDALFNGLRRTLPLIQYRADPLALADDVANWGDAVRKCWAYEYEWPEKARA